MAPRFPILRASTLRRSRPLGPGTWRIRTPHREAVTGFRRSYLLHVPPEAREGASLPLPTGRGLPLVIALHGAFDTARTLEEVSGLSRLADTQGAYVAYPNGIGLFGKLQHWNAGFCCGHARRTGLDDVGFVAHVIADVLERVAADPARVFMVGASNGGMFAYRYATERPGDLRGLAVVSGAIDGEPAKGRPAVRLKPPGAPLPVCIMHGLSDAVVPHAGGWHRMKPGTRRFAPLESAVEFWTANNGCPGEPERERFLNGKVLRRTWNGHCGQSRVQCFEIADWGHSWPSAERTAHLGQDPALGGESEGFDAARIAWRFFSSLI